MNSVSLNEDVTGSQTPWTLLTSWANRRGDSPFSVYTEPSYVDGSSTTIGWTTAAEITHELRQRLFAAGVREPQVVLLALPNSPAALLMLMAIGANGAIAHTVDPDLGILSLASAIDATQPVAVVAVQANAHGVSRAVASPAHNPALFVVEDPKLVNDAGNTVAAGVSGELLVRGEPGRTLMRGYWRNPAATASALDSNRWLRTGDTMQRERDGRFLFMGRRMHIIRRAGENVSSYELELLMQNCPLVPDVAVRAEADETLDARIVVHVIPAEGFTESGFRSWCRDSIGKRGVRDSIRTRTSFPRTPSGRVIDRELDAAP